MVRHVRTEAGSKKYGLPIGAPITARAIQEAAEKAGKAATPGKTAKAPAVRRLSAAEERRVGNVAAGLNPHRFGSRGEAEAFGKAQPKRIHPDAVAQFGEIANALRSGHGHERAEKIDAAMQPLDRDLVVTRHLPSSAFGPRRKVEFLVGKKITDKAYQPAALHQEPQHGGITMHITAPAGTRAMMAGDNEIWLDRDTQLAVQSVEPNDHGGYDVHAVVLTKPTRKSAKKAEVKAAEAPKPEPTAAAVEKPLPAEPAKPKALAGQAALDAAPIKLGKTDFERGVDGDLAQELDADALSMYRGEDYGFINDDLRDGIVKDSEYEWAINTIDAAMEHSKLSHEVLVHRGIKGLATLFPPSSQIDVGKSLVGLEYLDGAYMSTSADKAVTEEFHGPGGAILNLRVPAGVGAIQLSNFGPPPAKGKQRPVTDEAELLLQRGLRVRITGDKMVNGIRQLDAEVIPP